MESNHYLFQIKKFVNIPLLSKPDKSTNFGHFFTSPCGRKMFNNHLLISELSSLYLKKGFFIYLLENKIVDLKVWLGFIPFLVEEYWHTSSLLDPRLVLKMNLYPSTVGRRRCFQTTVNYSWSAVYLEYSNFF